jgi:hypothetical protein
MNGGRLVGARLTVGCEAGEDRGGVRAFDAVLHCANCKAGTPITATV